MGRRCGVSQAYLAGSSPRRGRDPMLDRCLVANPASLPEALEPAKPGINTDLFRTPTSFGSTTRMSALCSCDLLARKGALPRRSLSLPRSLGPHDRNGDQAQPRDSVVLTGGEQADAQERGRNRGCFHPRPAIRFALDSAIRLPLPVPGHVKRKRRFDGRCGDEAEVRSDWVTVAASVR